MTYEDLLAKIIELGIEAARADYGQRAGENAPQMLAGSIAGFEACHGKSPAELGALWYEVERKGHFSRREGNDDFWYWRCYAGEVEFVANVVSIGLQQMGQPAILPWLPTARGAMQYAKIVGVKELACPTF